MGFFSSLKGQLGRDTGRRISNGIFGNKHATKYQRVGSTSVRSNNSDDQKRNLKLQRDYELEILRQEKENEIEVLKKQKQFEEIKEKKTFVDQNLKKITSIKIPAKKELIIEQLNSLSIELTSNSWGDSDDEVNKISNIYTDALFKKYEQTLFALKTKYPSCVEIKYFEQQFDRYNKLRFWQKYKMFFFGILCIIGMGIGVYFEKQEKQETPIKDFFRSLTEKIK